MRTQVKKRAVAALAVGSALVAFAPVAGAATDVGNMTGSFGVGDTKQMLKGVFCNQDAGFNCVDIAYNTVPTDHGIASGVDAIQAYVEAHPNDSGWIIQAYSMSTQSMTDWLLEHADDPNVDVTQMRAILYGSPETPGNVHFFGGQNGLPDVVKAGLPASPGQPTGIVEFVVVQYDPVADVPDPTNFLAVVNSWLAVGLHTDGYYDIDSLDLANNVTFTDPATPGVTVVYHRTEIMPLVQAFSWLLGPEGTNAVNKALEPYVLPAYPSTKAFKLAEQGDPSTQLPNGTPTGTGIHLGNDTNVNDQVAVNSFAGSQPEKFSLDNKRTVAVDVPDQKLSLTQALAESKPVEQKPVATEEKKPVEAEETKVVETEKKVVERKKKDEKPMTRDSFKATPGEVNQRQTTNDNSVLQVQPTPKVTEVDEKKAVETKVDDSIQQSDDDDNTTR